MSAPLTPGARWVLLMLLFVPTLGIAFSDVLVDALMIEVGKPRNLTGRLQSVQWFAASLGLLCSGVVGGYLTSRNRHELAFLVCAALWSASFVLTLAFVREPQRAGNANELARDRPAPPGRARGAGVAHDLRDHVPLGRQPALILRELRPPHEHARLRRAGVRVELVRVLGRRNDCERRVWAVLPTVSCARAAPRAIAAGIVANVLYWWVASAAGLYVVSMLGGFAYMTGSLILLDLAARLVPLPVAATVFATIMALANLGSSVAEACGRVRIRAAAASYDAATAYGIVIVLSVLVIASCWSWVPRLRRQVPQWWE